MAIKANFNSLNRRKANICSSSLLLHIVYRFVCCEACLVILCCIQVIFERVTIKHMFENIA